jgi:prepilin-type N-terminal cleavage/methylation domain-containing protein
MPDLTVKHGCKNQTEFTQLAVKIQRKSAKSALGFSLLELLVVISLLGIVAMAATTLMIDTGEEKRKDATEKNWDAIRKAIVGDSNLTLNGSPVISGYVADMGRLPVNIKELMSKDYDFDHDVDLATAPIAIVQPAWREYDLGTLFPGLAVPHAPPAAPVAGMAKLSGGWRGPYLYTAGSKIYADAWGFRDDDYFLDTSNNFILDAENNKILKDSVNFNWSVIHKPIEVPPCNSLDTVALENDIATDCDGIQIQSLGDDHAIDTGPINVTENTDYTRDFPHANVETVVANDWSLNGAGISFTVRLNKLPAAGNVLQLRLYHFVDSIDVSADLATDVNIAQEISTQFTTTAVDTNYSVTFVPVAPLTTIKFPMGKYAAAVWCVDDPATPAPVIDPSVYDGDCVAPAIPLTSPIQSPYFFTLSPRDVTPIVIPWNIP